MPPRHIELFPNDVLAFIFNILMRDQGHDFINISGDFNVYTGGGDEYMSNLGTIDFAVLKDIAFKMDNNISDKDLDFTIANTRDSFCYNLLLYVVFNDNEQTIEYNTRYDPKKITDLKLSLKKYHPDISPDINITHDRIIIPDIRENISGIVSRAAHAQGIRRAALDTDSIADRILDYIALDERGFDILSKHKENSKNNNYKMTDIQTQLIKYYYTTINCNDDINIFNIIIYIYKCIYNDTSYIYLIGIADLFIKMKLTEFIESYQSSVSHDTSSVSHDASSVSHDASSVSQDASSVSHDTSSSHNSSLPARERFNYTTGQYEVVNEDNDVDTMSDGVDDTPDRYGVVYGTMGDDDNSSIVNVVPGTLTINSKHQSVIDSDSDNTLSQQDSDSDNTLSQQDSNNPFFQLDGGGSKNKLEIYKKHINYILGLNNNIQKGGLPPTSSTMKSFANMLRCFAFNTIGYDKTEYTDGIISIKMNKDADDPDIRIDTEIKKKANSKYNYDPYTDPENIKQTVTTVIPNDRFTLPTSYSKSFNPTMIQHYSDFNWFEFEKFSLTEHLTKNNSAVENDSFYYLIELLKQSVNGTYNISRPDPLSSPPVNIDIPALDDLSQISTFKLGVDKQIAKYKINDTNSINKIKFPIYKYSVLNNDLFRMLSKTFAPSTIPNKEQMKFIVNNESAITMKYGLKFDANGNDRPLDNVLHNYPTFIDPGSSGSNINQIIDEFGTYEMGFIGREPLPTSSSSTPQVTQQYTLIMEPRTGEHTITIKVSDNNYSATYIFKKNYTDFFNNGLSLNSWNECSAVIALANSFNALQNYYSVCLDIPSKGGAHKKITVKHSKTDNTKLENETLPNSFEWDNLYEDYGSIWYKHSSSKKLIYLKLTNIITEHIKSNVDFPNLTNVNFQDKTQLKNLHTNRQYYLIAKKVNLCLDTTIKPPNIIKNCDVYWAIFPPYFIFYQYSLFKGLGDISQEISTMTKWGGINEHDKVYRTTDTNVAIASAKFNETVSANTNNLYLKYDDYGNAPRCLISHDKASGSRFALLLLAALKCYIKKKLPDQNNINMLCFGGYTGKLIDSLFVKPNMRMVQSKITGYTYIENKVAPFNDILTQIIGTDGPIIAAHFPAVRYQGGKIKKKTYNKRKNNKTHKRRKNKTHKKINNKTHKRRKNKTHKK